MGIFDKLADKIAKKVIKAIEPKTPRIVVPSIEKQYKKRKISISPKTDLPKGFRRPIKSLFLNKYTDKQILEKLRIEKSKSPFWNWCTKRNFTDEEILPAINYWKDRQYNGKKLKPLKHRLPEQRTLAMNIAKAKERHEAGMCNSVCERYPSQCVPCNESWSDFVKIQDGTDYDKLLKGYNLWKDFSACFSHGHGDIKRQQNGYKILQEVQNKMTQKFGSKTLYETRLSRTARRYYDGTKSKEQVQEQADQEKLMQELKDTVVKLASDQNNKQLSETVRQLQEVLSKKRQKGECQDEW